MKPQLSRYLLKTSLGVTSHSIIISRALQMLFSISRTHTWVSHLGEKTHTQYRNNIQLQLFQLISLLDYNQRLYILLHKLQLTGEFKIRVKKQPARNVNLLK
jgi:hypothetical protein